MKNIKLFNLDSEYHTDKTNHEYPTVSYAVDSDTVYYMKQNEVSKDILTWFPVSPSEIELRETYTSNYPNKYDYLTKLIYDELGLSEVPEETWTVDWKPLGLYLEWNGEMQTLSRVKSFPSITDDELPYYLLNVGTMRMTVYLDNTLYLDYNLA